MKTENIWHAENAAINTLFSKICPGIQNLFGRWQDEKEYEDWNDYVTAMKSWLPEEAEFVSAGKRPFGITFKMAGKTYRFSATSRFQEWKRLA